MRKREYYIETIESKVIPCREQRRLEEVSSAWTRCAFHKKRIIAASTCKSKTLYRVIRAVHGGYCLRETSTPAQTITRVPAPTKDNNILCKTNCQVNIYTGMRLYLFIPRGIYYATWRKIDRWRFATSDR